MIKIHSIPFNSNSKLNLPLGLLPLLITLLLSIISIGQVAAQQKPQVIRLAKLVIDSAQLDNYKAALKEEVETSVRVEAGVITLYAVYDKDKPTHVTVFEIYADEDAYLSHLKTPHFLKYKTTTKDMVKSLELGQVVPIALEAKHKH